MNLKERLEKLVANPRPIAPDGTPLATLLTASGAKKVLALLKAAKDFHEWSEGGDDDSYYSTKDTLRNAIKAMEADQ